MILYLILLSRQIHEFFANYSSMPANFFENISKIRLLKFEESRSPITIHSNRNPEMAFDHSRERRGGGIIARAGRSFEKNLSPLDFVHLITRCFNNAGPFSPLCRAIVPRETAASIRSPPLHNEWRRFTTCVPYNTPPPPPSRWIVVRETTNYRRVSSHPARSIAFCLGNSPSCVPPPLHKFLRNDELIHPDLYRSPLLLASSCIPVTVLWIDKVRNSSSWNRVLILKELYFSKSKFE